MAACLISVVWGEPYERYAKGLFDSARHYFPGDTVLLRGVPGWPAATLYRYHVILENAEQLQYDYLYLSDADMRFEAPAGEKILAPLVGTLHPGYVHRRSGLPYEERPESAAFVPSGHTYYAGGFVGGEREAFLDLARKIAFAIDEDDRNGILARWHDESHLNRVFSESPPDMALPPSYSYPDNASAYPWLEEFPRILVAVDKTPEERAGR